ncbi:MAG: alpha/beta hydrolase [Bacteroidales bacterium]|jgi:hypothetical protein|nr:alpha/beta hydrolase [Bacteroidales bacterium]
MIKKIFIILCVLIPFSSYGSGIFFKLEEALDHIDTSVYYYGKFNNILYFLKFEETGSNGAKGFYFDAEKKLYADKKEFEIKKTSKKLYFYTENKEYELKSRIQFSPDSIFGEYAVKEKSFLFFKKFKWKDPVSLKKYSPPEFKEFPDRYKTKIFDDLLIKKDIIYGKVRGYWDSYIPENDDYLSILQKGISSSIMGKNLLLKMDIYMPEEDTSGIYRPFIMFIHGGGFYIGDKQEESMVEFCKYFSSLGYITASINYRLGFKPSGLSLERAGYRALQDAHAAMRYIVENSNSLKIDTSLLFVAGPSAGAITALNLAFMNNESRPECSYGSLFYRNLGNINSSTNNIKADFQIKAVASMWGAVYSLDILHNSRTAIISFHSNGDKIVPIDHNYPFRDIKGNLTSYILNKVYGSALIHQKAQEIGLREELHKYEVEKHTIYTDENDNINEEFNIISENIRDFFHEEMIYDQCSIISIPKLPYKAAMMKYQTSNHNYKELYWKIEGGLILSTEKNSVNVIWFKDANIHKLTLSGFYKGGARLYNEYEF